MHLSSAAVSAHVESCWHFAHASCNYVCTKLVTLSNHSNSWISIMLLMFLLTKWWLTCIKFDFPNLLPYNAVILIALRKWNCQEIVLGRNKMPNFNPCWGTVVWSAWIRNCTPHIICGIWSLSFHYTFTRHVVPHIYGYMAQEILFSYIFLLSYTVKLPYDMIIFIHKRHSIHWNGNVVTLMQCSSLTLKVVKMTTSSAATDENFTKMTFPVQCSSLMMVRYGISFVSFGVIYILLILLSWFMWYYVIIDHVKRRFHSYIQNI